MTDKPVSPAEHMLQILETTPPFQLVNHIPDMVAGMKDVVSRLERLESRVFAPEPEHMQREALAAPCDDAEFGMRDPVAKPTHGDGG